jgi:clorobiocin biosynthesis protein CloN6
MVEPIWHRRLNYETEWMSRKEIRDVSYEAISRLVQKKGEIGVLPEHIARGIIDKIADTLDLLSEADRALELDGKFPADLRARVRDYNKQILSHSSDQITPMERPFGGRWFDDYAISKDIVAACT